MSQSQYKIICAINNNISYRYNYIGANKLIQTIQT